MEMKNARKLALICFALLATFPNSASAQQATLSHNVNLRRDPSTSSPILARLRTGSRLSLVDATTDSGFYHVRTEDDQVGWIWSKFVSVSSKPVLAATLTPGPPTAGSECDDTLWTHVYHPMRLIVKQPCIAVTGTFVDATNGSEPDGVRHEADGDTHGWLKPDPQFQNLLNAGNISDEGGNLVFEVVCKFPVTQPDAQTACQGFTNQVNLPAVGAHVRIIGSLVQDTFHAQWIEIHPVTSITVIP
jgi:Bacterial SH3 domain